MNRAPTIWGVRVPRGGRRAGKPVHIASVIASLTAPAPASVLEPATQLQQAVIVHARVSRLLASTAVLRAAVGYTSPTDLTVAAGLRRFAVAAMNEPRSVVRAAAAHVTAMLLDIGEEHPSERLGAAFAAVAEEVERGLD